MKKPNLFIVGAPKCGTTSLSEYLKTHPEVFMSVPKEPHFFSREDIKGYECCSVLDDYLKLFKDANEKHKVVAEASVMYLYSEFALKNIYKFNPEAKIIVMLRNPVDYIYSYHSQKLLNGDENIKSFEKAWSLQRKRKLGRAIPSSCRAEKLLYYKEVGLLGEQVEKLLKIFPKAQVHFILMDDLKNNTKKMYDDVLNFLEIPNDGRVEFPVINENKRNKIQFLGALKNNPPKNILKVIKNVKKIMGIENISLMKKIYEKNIEKVQREPLSRETRMMLVDTFSSDIDKLSKLINRDLNKWKEIKG